MEAHTQSSLSHDIDGPRQSDTAQMTIRPMDATIEQTVLYLTWQEASITLGKGNLDFFLMWISSFADTQASLEIATSANPLKKDELKEWHEFITVYTIWCFSANFKNTAISFP